MLRMMTLLILVTSILGCTPEEEPQKTETPASSDKAAVPAPEKIGHVFTKKSELSRDHTYIAFQHNTEPYTVTEEVGGEYISNTKIIAFKGDRFQIEVSPKNDKINFYVEGSGIEVTDGADAFIKTAAVKDVMEAFVHISLTAHPSETITLTVTPLAPEE